MGFKNSASSSNFLQLIALCTEKFKIFNIYIELFQFPYSPCFLLKKNSCLNGAKPPARSLGFFYFCLFLGVCVSSLKL